MKVTVREAVSSKDLKRFVHFPNELYRDNPYYVPQIESMDRNTIDPGRYNNASEVIRAGLRMLEENESKRLRGFYFLDGTLVPDVITGAIELFGHIMIVLFFSLFRELFLHLA